MLLSPEWDNMTWCCYRAWAVARATGLLPLQVFSAGELPRELESCPLCGRPSADLEHILLNCKGTSDLFIEWRVAAGTDLHSRDKLHYTALLDAVFTG